MGFIFLLFAWLFCVIFGINIGDGKLIHNRPANGIGSFLLSHDDSHEHYNDKTLMVTFDLECLNGNEEIQGNKINSIINHFDGCLSQHSTTKKHFQHNKYGISFLQFNLKQDEKNGVDCINNHTNGKNFDYDLHCVHMFSYEPIYYLTDYTRFNDSSQYNCITESTNASLLPSGSAWGLAAIDSATNDNLFTYPYIGNDNDNGVDLYIVDTGIRASHDEFYPGQVIHELGDGHAQYVPYGYVASHGTHVAGTAGGKNYGVSKNLTIYDYRVCVYSEYDTPSWSGDTVCYTNLILTALDMIEKKLANNNRRGVINLSLGGGRSFFSYSYEYYFNSIIENGGIVTVAAGNSYADACGYSPAFTPSALTVGAVGPSLTMAYFSNWGDCVDVWAPGQDIYSGIADSDSSYASYQGTSMASPHICGFVANLLLINPLLTYNDIKFMLKASENLVSNNNSSYLQITNDKCDPDYNNYFCVFPLFNCHTLPQDYPAFDYAESSTEPPIHSNYTRYDEFIDYDCNTVGIAVIDDDIEDSSNPLNIAVSNVMYEPTDVCATMKTDDNSYISWSYLCVDENVAAFVVWDGEHCDSSIYDVMVVKYIYDGFIDNGYWYGVACENEHVNYENSTEYKASTGDDNECAVRFRFWFAKDWILTNDAMPQVPDLLESSNLNSKSHDTELNDNNTNSDNNNNNNNINEFGMNGINSLLLNGSYSGNYRCNGYNTSEDTYIDYVYAIGTCNVYRGGSYDISCNKALGYLKWNYYSTSDCTGPSSPAIGYQGCYETQGYYLDILECGTEAIAVTPAPVEWIVDYIWYVGDNSRYSTEETFGCSNAGCSVSKNWEIYNQCLEPRITVSILENDYAQPNEEAFIYINNEYYGSCESLANDANYEFIECIFEYNYTLVDEYINPDIKNDVQRITITLDATDYVNYHVYNGYQLLGKVRFDCGFPANFTSPTAMPLTPTMQPTPEPTAAPINYTCKYDFKFNIKLDNYPHEVSWILYDDRMVAILTGNSFLASDYAEINQTICLDDGNFKLIIDDNFGDGIYSHGDFGWYRIFLEDEQLTLGKTTFNDDSTTFKFRTDYLTPKKQKQTQNDMIKLSFGVLDMDFRLTIRDSQTNDTVWFNTYQFPIFMTTVSNSEFYIADGCYFFDWNETLTTGTPFYYKMSIDDQLVVYESTAASHYFCTDNISNITIESPPTTTTATATTTTTYKPTLVVDDTYFLIDSDGTDSKTSIYSCDTANCGVSKTWNIIGICANPTLSLSVIETDFSSTTETVSVYINESFVGTCEPLNQDCTHTLINCTNFTERSVSRFISETASSQIISIFIDTSYSVNFCPYNGAYLYAYVTLSCEHETTASPTPNPTPHPTPDPTSIPTDQPTEKPTALPTFRPWDPTSVPTRVPTPDPTVTPTSNPTATPTTNPTDDPTRDPTHSPTRSPTPEPTQNPTVNPTANPTANPTTNPTRSPTYYPTSSPSEISECEVINWYNLLYKSDNNSVSPQTDISTFVMSNNIDIDISVSSDYVVTSKYESFEDYYKNVYQNTSHNGNLPITYLLTFEQFTDFTQRQLDEPGSCDNRRPSSYARFNSSTDYAYDYWTFTTNPGGSGNLGNDNYMEYPNPNVWDMSFSESSNDTNSKCSRVTWKAQFTLSDMLNIASDGCFDSNGDSSFTFIDDEENGVLSLQGTLYLYLVSPDPLLLAKIDTSTIDEMQTNYLYHAVLSHPISIDFEKVSSHSAVSNDIIVSQGRLSMLGNTIYGTNYDEETQIFSMDILTWCPEYMIYTLQNGFYGFQWLSSINANVTFMSIESIYGNECLTISYGRCFQKFRASILVNQCEEGGVSLDSVYLMWLTSSPANESSIDDIQNWLDTIDTSASGNDTQTENVPLFFDLLDFEYFESCESFSFSFELDEIITFYEDDRYSDEALITSDNPLFASNSVEQVLYVEIDVGSSVINGLITGNASIADVSVLDVWFCVYESISDTNMTVSTSCFESGGNNVELWYLYSTTSSATDDGYMTSSNIISDSSSNLVKQFSFILPIISNSNVDTFGVQINVELSLVDSTTDTNTNSNTNITERRVLLNSGTTFNKLKETFKSGSITMSSSQNESKNNNENENIFGKQAWFDYLIFSVVALLAISVCINLYLMREKRKSQNRTSLHAESIEMRTSIANGDIESGGNINGEIVTQHERIPF